MDATLGAAPDPLLLAAEILDPPGGGVEAYYDDPVGFVHNCIRWDKGKGPTTYQERNMRLLIENGRLAVRGPHGLGKTTTNAWTVLWFALTRDARGVDWKVLTTASAWRQLEEYLWPEIAKWAMRIRWGVVGRSPFTPGELMRLSLRLTHGKATAVACEDPAKIEGAHADSLLYIYDEAKTIPPETFDASEGAFSGAGSDTDAEAFALASSTPGAPAGRFYDIHAHREGLEDWTAVHVTKEELIAEGRMSREWAQARARLWGTDSAVYLNRVEGNFATGESDGVIPLDWVEKAMDRWKALAEAEEMPSVKHLTCVGADIAEEGGDQTVLAPRYGDVIGELRRERRGDVMEATGHIVAVLRGAEGHPPAIVDAIGLGAGVVPRLREQGYSAVAFKSSKKTKMKDASRELEFLNTRAAAYWRARDLLDPANGHDIALPPDDILIGDLTAPKWWIASSGKIQIENKKEIRERLGRSPDCGDAVVQALWHGAGASATPIQRVGQQSRWHPMRERATQASGVFQGAS